MGAFETGEHVHLVHNMFQVALTVRVTCLLRPREGGGLLC